MNHVQWNVKPGDLIEWFYTSNDEKIAKGCTIWSSTMNEHINISKEMLLISYADGIWSALSEGRFIHARVDDAKIQRSWQGQYLVHPRTRG